MNDKRSDLSAPYVISDTMDPVKGMHNGRMYDSKSQIRASYRENGYEEVGNDLKFDPDKDNPHTKIKRTVEDETNNIKNSLFKAFSQMGIS